MELISLMEKVALRGTIHPHKRWKAYDASVQSLHTPARYWEGAMAKKPPGSSRSCPLL